MATPSLYPLYLKAQAGGGGTFVRINLDEIDFELQAEPVATLDPLEVAGQVTADVKAALDTGSIAGAVETETTAELDDELGGEVDC